MTSLLLSTGENSTKSHGVLVTSLVVPPSLLQVFNTLFKTCSRNFEKAVPTQHVRSLLQSVSRLATTCSFLHIDIFVLTFLFQDSNIDYSTIDEDYIKQHSVGIQSDELLHAIAKYIAISSAILLVLAVIGWAVAPILKRRFAKTHSSNGTNKEKD